ncbi:hypothetical protein D3C71_1592000 [compost metagenome]
MQVGGNDVLDFLGSNIKLLQSVMQVTFLACHPRRRQLGRLCPTPFDAHGVWVAGCIKQNFPLRMINQYRIYWEFHKFCRNVRIIYCSRIMHGDYPIFIHTHSTVIQYKKLGTLFNNICHLLYLPIEVIQHKIPLLGAYLPLLERPDRP